MKILLYILTLLCFVSPFIRGLYFEAYFLPFQIITFVIFILWGIIKWRKKDNHILKTKIEYIALGLVIVYIVSIFTSVAIRSAILESLKYLMFFTIFIMLSDFFSEIKHRDLVLKIFLLSYLLVSIVGLDSFLGGGIVPGLNNLLAGLNIDFTFNGLVVEKRIGSVLQYPNALAACLCTMIFLTISLYINESKIYKKTIYIAVSYIFLITLLITVSRGMFIIIPAALLLYIFILPKEFRIEVSLLMALLGLITIPVFLKVYSNATKIDQGDSRYWIYIILGLLLVCSMGIGIKRVSIALNSIKLKTAMYMLVLFSSIAVISIFFLLKATMPLSINTSSNGEIESTRKRAVLEPGNSYRLEIKVEASTMDKEKPAYFVRIANKNESQVVQLKETTIAELSGAEASGIATESINFTVPMDSKMLNFHFGSKAKNTKVTFYSAEIYEIDTNKLAEKIVLKYKYIPKSISDRFEAFISADTGISRLVYYKDASKIIKDHAIIGAGGGAWSVLYRAYQSMYYLTNDPHSYLVKLTMETGIIGVIIFILLIAMTAYAIVKRKMRNEYENTREHILEAGTIAALSAMILHSLIDLDFSIPAVFLIFWMLMSILNASARKANKSIKGTSKEYLIKTKSITIIAIFLIGLVFSSRFLISQYYVKQSQISAKENSSEKVMEYLEKAVQADPYLSMPRIKYANLLVRKGSISKDIVYEAYNHISKAEKLSYYNADEMAQIAAFYLALGDAGRGLTAVDRSAAISPLWIDVWYQKAEAYQNVVMALFKQGQTENAVKMLDKTLNIINEISQYNAKADTPIIMDRATKLIIERMSYVREYINKEPSIDINRIIFNSINSLDVNNNDSPDQWEIGTDFTVDYSKTDDTLTISGVKKEARLISAKPIALEETNKYRIYLEPAEASAVNNIGINIYGFYDNSFKIADSVMTKTGEGYYLDFELTKGKKSDLYNFDIIVNGDCKIRKILITKM